MEGNRSVIKELVESNFYVVSGTVILFLAVSTCFLSGVLLCIIKVDPLRTFSTRPIVSFTCGSCYAHVFLGVFGLYFGISEICRVNGSSFESGNALNFASFTGVACAFLLTYRMFLSTSVMYERYLAFKLAHLHRRFVTKRNVSLLHVFLALGLLIFSVALWFLQTNRKTYLLFYVHTFVTLPLIALFGVEILHYWNMKHMSLVSAVNKDIPLGTKQVLRERQRGIARSRKFIGIAVINTVPLLTSILPWYTLALKFIHSHDLDQTTEVVPRDFVRQRVAVAFMFIEAVITPLIYVRNRDYRNSAKLVWVRLRRR